MTDVFGEVQKNIETNPDDERLSKITSILADLKKNDDDLGSNIESVEKETVNDGQNKKNDISLDKTSELKYNTDNGDLQAQLDEATETIAGLLEELEEKDNLEKELAKAKITIRDLEAQIEALSMMTKNYMEKSQSLEYDASRMQVPPDFVSLIKYYKDAQGTDEYAKEAKKLMQLEIMRLTEKFTGKPLTGYIQDFRAFGSEPIDGSISSMSVPKQEQKKQLSSDVLGNIF